MTKPVKPNIEFPQAFAIDGQKTDFLDEKIQSGFDPIDPDVLAGDNLNKLIDDIYKGLHYSMDGVNDLYKGAVLYDPAETYTDKSIVFNIDENGDTAIFRSLVNDNNGNALSDISKWKKMEITASWGDITGTLSNQTDLTDYVNQSKALETGAVSSDADVYADVLKYKNSGTGTGIDTIKPDNYEVVGSPTISEDGIASGFDANSYIISTENFNLSAKKFKIKYHCKIGQPRDSIGVVGLYNKQGLPVINIVYNYYTVGVILRENFSGAGDISTYTSSYTGLSYTANFEIENNTVTINVLYDDGTTRTANVDFSELDVSSWGELQLRIGRCLWIGENIEYLDLNSVELENNCNLVYQPCLKIPYTQSKTGSKIVDAAYRDRVQDVYEQYGTAMYYTLDEENQNFTLPMGDIYGMIEKKNEELNNPFSLFDSKYSETPVYNLSWLLSDGTYYSKSVYVTAYEALVVENNSEIEAGTSVTLPSGGNYVKRGLSVKLSTAEDITDFDFVINTTDETFKLPLLNGSEINIDYSQGVPITSGYIAPCNGVVSGGNNSLRNTSAVLRINDEIVAYAWGGDVTQDGTNIYVKVSKGDEITFTNLNTVEASTRNPVTFFPAAGNGLLYFYVGETVQNANLIDAGRIAELFTTKQFATSASFPSDRYTNLSLGASNSNYTAPADGYFVFDKSSTSSNQYVALFNTTSGVRSSNMSAGGSNPMSIFVPAKKNDTVNVQYNAGGNVIDFKFVYAEGAKND